MVWLETRGRVPSVLTIAGSDSSCGAGVEADLKTLSAIGVYCLAAVTAVTAQTPAGVKSVHALPPEAVKEQIDAACEAAEVAYAKTGMLGSREVVEAVAEAVDRHGLSLVVDPVLRARDGTPLADEDTFRALVDALIPRALVVTPNASEAEKVAGMRISSVSEAEEAAKAISRLGPEAVVIKGGHLGGGESIDVLYWRGRVVRLSAPRLPSDPHGTGCCFSAAIAGYLALGLDIEEAVKAAKRLVHAAISHAIELRGASVANPMASLYLESEKYRVVSDLYRAFRELASIRGAEDLVPECRMNFVYALPGASSTSDVAGFPGRITVVEGRLYAASKPEFGASSHMARVVLEAMRHDPRVRSAINIRYSRDLVRRAAEAGLTVACFSRGEEPEEVKRIEGMSLRWGVLEAVKRTGKVPDVIYDEGEPGKEPMIRILGKDPWDILEKLKKILKTHSKH